MLRRKLTLRLPQELHTRIGVLAVANKLLWPNGAPRYAETTRVLLVGQILREYPLDTRIAAAVLSNATLILSAALAQLTYDLESDLERIAASATKTKLKDLTSARSRQKLSQYDRTAGFPVVHLTFDHWLFRFLKSATQSVPKEMLRGTGFRSAHAYVLTRLLQDALEQSDPGPAALVSGYATAAQRIRRSVEDLVASERETFREGLRSV